MTRRGRTIRARIAAAAAFALVAIAGCSRGANTSPVTSSGAPSATSSAATSSAAIPSATPPSAAGPAPALLATLAVKGRAPLTGYDRSLYGTAWTDDNDDPGGHNGCDTRNDILRRDLGELVLKPGSHGCAVLTGTLHDPYTGRVLAFRRGVGTSTAVQIDHVVALADSWQTGAQQWTAGTRTDFANDPLNLLAVDGPTNESKGDGDSATWLPPNKAFRCAYVARQIAVKARYRLWVTPAERAVDVRILATCPTEPVPTQAAATGPEPTDDTTPTP